MEIRTDRFDYRLFQSGLKLAGKDVDIQSSNICVYVAFIFRAVRHSVWSSVKDATDIIYSIIMLICVTVILALVTILANLVTIPLGIGVAWAFSAPTFIAVPFRVSHNGRSRRLVWYLAPFWILIAVVTSLWIGASNDAHETTRALAGIICAVAVAIVFVGCCVLLIVLAELKQNGKLQCLERIAQTWQLVKAYCAAKIDRYCIKVEFVSPPTTTVPPA